MRDGKKSNAMTKDPTKIKLQTNVTADRDPTLVRMSGITTHKLMPFDVPFMTEIAHNLWQGGCQDGLQLPHFIKHIVSLYPWEAYAIHHNIDSSLTVKMYDSLQQDTEKIQELARWVNICRKEGPVLVHCQAGLNRSSVVVARALMLEGKTADEAIDLLRENRSPACLCNSAFEDYLRRV